MSLVLTSNLTINGQRLLRYLQHLAQVGALPQGGVKRPAFSPEDLQARSLIIDWMKEVGMRVRIDAAGNIIGTYPGQNPDAPPIATGSHLDTVPNGGCYDGSLGVLAGLEVINRIQETKITLDRSLELIVFTDEEGTMVGSKAMVGETVTDPTKKLPTGLAKIGGNWENLATAQRQIGEIFAFIELHVEQGPILESEAKAIGIVEGIVAQRRFQILIIGQENHAGTTPMNMRQDALVAASEVVLAVRELGLHTIGKQVATVGQMQVFPNVANVIPGRVEMSLDLRDLSEKCLDELLHKLEAKIKSIARQTETNITIDLILKNAPAPASPLIQQTIAQGCQDLGYSYTYLPSRASHDAQMLAKITEMGMIFVPSQGGVSHNITEFTPPDRCIQGANVLLQTILRLGQI